MEPTFIKQADVLIEATMVLSDAVHRLRKSRKLSDLSDALIEIHTMESIGDDNHHAAMSRLFSGEHRAAGSHEVEGTVRPGRNAIDGCEDVGNTLERIVLKNG